MSGGTLLRRRPAARTPIALWAVAALAAACGSDPAAPGTSDGEELPEPCDAVGVAGDPYVAGVNCRTVDVDGYPREYFVYVPAGYTFTAETPAPVVLLFHGGGQEAERLLLLWRWREKADEVGLIAVFPQSLEYLVLASGQTATRWNVYTLPDLVDLTVRPDGYPDAAPWPADDVAFTRAMLDDLESVLPVDPDAAYVSGFSNGANFAARLAIEATDQFAAFAYVGGPGLCYPVDTDWTAAPPRPVYKVIGTKDSVVLNRVRYESGQEFDVLPLAADSILDTPYVGACLESEVGHFDLAWEPYEVREDSVRTNFRWSTPLAGGAGQIFQFTMLRGVEHVYPFGGNNPLGWVAADRFWEFFRDHRRAN